MMVLRPSPARRTEVGSQIFARPQSDAIVAQETWRVLREKGQFDE